MLTRTFYSIFPHLHQSMFLCCIAWLALSFSPLEPTCCYCCSSFSQVLELGKNIESCLLLRHWSIRVNSVLLIHTDSSSPRLQTGSVPCFAWSSQWLNPGLSAGKNDTLLVSFSPSINSHHADQVWGSQVLVPFLWVEVGFWRKAFSCR